MTLDINDVIKNIVTRVNNFVWHETWITYAQVLFSRRLVEDSPHVR